MNFAEEVKALRLARSLSLREFCRRVNWDASNWSKIERNILPPPQDNGKFDLIMSALGVEPGTEKYQEMKDLASLAAGYIPKDLMSDDRVLNSLPMFFRTVRSEKPTSEDLDMLIEKIKKGG